MNFYITLIIVASVLVARGALVTSGPVSEVDCNTMIVQLRELYRILMSNGGIPGFHEMVRKAQRIPSLRLRFGKRDLAPWMEPRPAYEVEKDHYTD
ncbi:uncharacterized protein LOC129959139 isoform X2 [Argiope bruennichi]|uniref:uncharacterized protein LOC129959139 isoform X2 n=1 Tax=Argiope bruennichi TaxID=94029 RepID=UPI0024953308|nr:uncharacterized protein LOC129959139 isoform X2 [Argiope bruennichi]